MGRRRASLAATRERFLAGATVGQLRAVAARGRPAGRRPVASWNIRWIGDPSNALSVAKKRVLECTLSAET
eukprot:3585066-Lingulodinium_polyedra.AAC.1